MGPQLSLLQQTGEVRDGNKDPWFTRRVVNPLHHGASYNVMNIVAYCTLILCMLGNFSYFCCNLLTFFKVTFSNIIDFIIIIIYLKRVTQTIL